MKKLALTSAAVLAIMSLACAPAFAGDAVVLSDREMDQISATSLGQTGLNIQIISEPADLNAGGVQQNNDAQGSAEAPNITNTSQGSTISQVNVGYFSGIDGNASQSNTIAVSISKKVSGSVRECCSNSGAPR